MRPWRGGARLGGGDCDVKVISDLKALRLKRHGVICTFASRNCVANLFNPTTNQMGCSKQIELTKLEQKAFCIDYL